MGKKKYCNGHSGNHMTQKKKHVDVNYRFGMRISFIGAIEKYPDKVLELLKRYSQAELDGTIYETYNHKLSVLKKGDSLIPFNRHIDHSKD